ncbi:MAG: TetR/AcrR family transcriptional regulator [Gemmatimonadetes bacterium]|nr:TetR/AcrR family transcriptional regulator [Gemmatimonadota bacterium]
MEDVAARPPKQHRSRQTLQRIVRAALELIGQDGVEGTTVGAIARRAGSSVGSFYARFEGKTDLLLYLDERIWETVDQRWSDALAEGLADRPIDQLVRGLARLYADMDLVHRGARDAIGRALRGPGAGPSDAAVRIRARVREDSTRLLLEKRDAIVHSDPELAVETVCRTLETASGDFDPLFLEDLCSALVTHLVGDRPSSPSAGASVEFFDIWS